jgi:hypothetical protein
VDQTSSHLSNTYFRNLSEKLLRVLRASVVHLFLAISTRDTEFTRRNRISRQIPEARWRKEQLNVITVSKVSSGKQLKRLGRVLERRRSHLVEVRC